MATATREERPLAAGAIEQFLPGFRLIRLLARGGFAEVWEAEQTSLGRKVAVKILRHELLGQEQMVQLFENEARVLARLNHSNVVQVIDRGSSSRGPYFVMEYLEGETLQEMLSRGTLSRDRALQILLHAVRGLAYAHRNNVVHRDVKPANILVSRRGQVKIGDFGIAAVKAATEEHDDEQSQSGKQALGTRAFMAPEQRVSFDDVGPQADVYSLGVILHRIVTGKLPPGPGQTVVGVKIPERLQPIVDKSLHPSPTRRHADAGAFRDALINALEGRHIDDGARNGVATALGGSGRFELLDVIRQDDRRSVYLVRKGGADGDRIVVKRYVKDSEALRTVRNLLRIDHPNIVRIHAVGEREDAFIMLMEHLGGGDLRERLVRAHPWEEVARVGRDVALALAHAAKHGITHGNLRPSNILFSESGAIKVADFGLPEHYRGESDKRNWYAAPEGSRGTQSDLYALGAILFEMLYACPVPDTVWEHWSEYRKRADVPDAMLAVLKQMLAPVGQRYELAEHVAQALSTLIDERDAADRARQTPDLASLGVDRKSSSLPWGLALTCFGAGLGVGLLLGLLIWSR